MQSQRPLAITVVCIIRFLVFGLSLFTVPLLISALGLVHVRRMI